MTEQEWVCRWRTILMKVLVKNSVKVKQEEWKPSFYFPEEKKPYMADYQREVKAAFARWEDSDYDNR